MLKFRKMQNDASGPPLTSADDDRFTRVGRFLARSKLDELPQLLNVIRGQMSLVGPRPEDPEFVALHPYAYETINLSRPGVTGMFYSLHSLDARSGVDQFKYRMGYGAQPVRQRVAFHPWAAPFFNRATHAALRRLAQWQPGAPVLAKAEGMLRFYLEGRPAGQAG